MKNKRFKLILVSSVIAILTGSSVYAEENATNSKIYRITLKDDKTITQLSQQLGIEFIEYPLTRSVVFVELLQSPSTMIIKVLPKTVNTTYKIHIYDTGQQEYVKPITDQKTVSRISTESSDHATYVSREHETILTKKPDQPATELYEISLTDRILTSSDKAMNLEFGSNAFKNSLMIELKSDILLPIDPEKDFSTPIYQYDIKNTEDIDRSVPITVKIKYNDTNTGGSKSIYFFDKGYQTWIQLPSYHNVEERYVETKLFLTYAPIAILTDHSSDDGIASWYAYKNCLCAASRLYEKGTQLEVTRLLTKQTVVVTVNDYGPEEWTGRIIDLDKMAFEEIGSLGAGLIYVNVRPHD